MLQMRILIVSSRAHYLHWHGCSIQNKLNYVANLDRFKALYKLAARHRVEPITGSILPPGQDSAIGFCVGEKRGHSGVYIGKYLSRYILRANGLWYLNRIASDRYEVPDYS